MPDIQGLPARGILLATASLGLALTVGLGLSSSSSPAEGHPLPEMSSVRLLPDPGPGEAAYSGKARAEELLHPQSEIDGLEVAGRTPALQSVDRADVKTQGLQLGVARVLTRSIRRGGTPVPIGVRVEERLPMVLGAPNGLRINHRTDPLGLQDAAPRFSWRLTGTGRGARQTAYRIVVATLAANVPSATNATWDSGKVVSAQSIEVDYGGPDLLSRQRYFWAVQVWNSDDLESNFSAVAFWEMGLLQPGDWQGQWIGDGRSAPALEQDFYDDHPAPLLRREFQVFGSVRRARLYISGLGYYEAFLNGVKIGDQVLDPGWTEYAERILYSTFDVTSMLQSGNNAIGVMLGNGWYNPLPLRFFGTLNQRDHLTIGMPKVIATLAIDYADGSDSLVVTDSAWTTHDGPILRNNVYLGEKQDARLAQDGWSSPGFDDSAWQPAVFAEAPGGQLTAQAQPPIRITGRLEPVAVTEPDPGSFVIDMGQNFAGWVRMRVQGTAGTEVKLRYGELLHPGNGRLNGLTAVAGQIKAHWGIDGGPGAPPTAYQEDTYILRGGDVEYYQPHFTFHGFRYVEVRGYPGTPTVDDFVGLRLSADLERTGSFECSNELFNQIREMVDWTFLSNVFSVQSDCPGREKWGYGGDIVVSAEAFIYSFDMARFYGKVVRDFASEARPGGGVPDTAPDAGPDLGQGDGAGAVGWQLAHPRLLELAHQFYGDRRLIEEQYARTVGIVDFLGQLAVNDMLERGIGDYLNLDPATLALTSTAFYYHHATAVASFARLLGNAADAGRYEALAAAIKTAFITRFLDPATGQFDTGTQTAQAVALWYDLTPPDQRAPALGVLISAIEQRHSGHVSTGMYGTKMMLDVLRRSDRNDVAFSMADKRDYPGWGRMIGSGATTIWEHWSGEQDLASHNHPLLGSINEWFYRSLLGINPAADAVGFDKAVIRPQGTGLLEWVRGHYTSVRGDITVQWRNDAGDFVLDVTIPPNMTAVIHVPTAGRSNFVITESFQEVFSNGPGRGLSPELDVQAVEDDSVVFAAASGTYHFVVR
jgi:alpha-L-rhamnosidase